MSVDASISRPLIEVCTGNLADVAAAMSAGADRIELCSALELGGLTPSIGLARLVLEQTSLPVVAMVRPRSGGFAYGGDEFLTMLRDSEALLDAGVQGLVFGFLTSRGEVDTARCKEFVREAGDRETVFHRAIDFTRDPMIAAVQLAEIGVSRVLTSGGAADALAGAAKIAAMREAVGGSLQVLPGGGIRAENVQLILQQTGCDQIHVGASVAMRDGSLSIATEIKLTDSRCSDGAHYRAVDVEQLKSTIAAAKSL